MKYTIVVLFCWIVIAASRFQREELGVPDRLRFTSGKNTFYDCDIVNGKLVSNLKIGIYIYDHKLAIRYATNNTNFMVKERKVQDFYFAQITVKNPVHYHKQHVVKLVAKDDSDIFVDETLLKISSPRIISSSAPTFVNDSNTNIVIYDDVFVGSSIGKLAITNKKVPVTFYLGKSSTLQEFGVTVDGSIIITKRLNANQKNFYEFKVYAKHQTTSPSASITLVVAVKKGLDPKRTATLRNLYHTFTNDYKPAYSALTTLNVLTFYLSEFATKYTIVGEVGFRKEKLTYVIRTGNKDGAFKIEGVNGIITVNDPSQIDFEQKKKYTLEINDFANIFQIALQVEIIIIDENDNSPVFSKSKYLSTIDENAAIGTTVLQVSATDKDTGSNGLVRYIFSNKEEHPFSMLLDGTIVVSKSLDLIYQNQVHYLYVKALDMGYPIRRETEQLVKIKIKLMNIHTPVLHNINCDLFFNLRGEGDRELLKLDGVDKDIDTSLTFGVVEKTKDIAINQTSGIVYWRGSLEKQNLKFTFYAFDGLHKSDELVVNTRFVDEESSAICKPNKDFKVIKDLLEKRKLLPKPTKKPAVIEKSKSPLTFTKSSEESIYISEDASPSTVIAHYKAHNPNSQSYGIVFYSIVDGNSEGKFEIDLKNGTLFLRQKLGREQTPLYHLIIQASDGVNQKVITSLRIEVENVEDIAPKFENNGKYEIQVKEKENIGRTLVTVKAKGIRNYGLTYSLVTPSSIFEIEPKSGALRLKSSLTRQPYKEYLIEIQVSNQTRQDPMYGYAVVHIKVIGVTNHPPICLIEEQRIEISTNTPAGIIIGRVFAYDVDEGNAGKIIFTVKGKDNTHFDDYFSISSHSGLISLKRDLSAHDKGIVFRIKVEVSDLGQPALSTICHIYKIIVDDVGVTQPSFIQNEYPFPASIPYNSSRGTFVGKLKAVLPGNETTQSVRYTLVDGSGIGLFTIDNVLGSIYVSDNTTVMPFYWLTVQAYMIYDPSSYRNAHVLIQVSDQRQRNLFFKPSVYHVNLYYKEERARKIVQLYATDGAKRYNLKGLIYGIHAGDKHLFTVDDSGLLRSKDFLDIGVYHLNVTVSNPRSNVTITSYGYVVVEVKADNSQPPVFSDGRNFDSQPIFVFETTKRGFSPPYLFQLMALNPNPGERIHYSNSFQGTFNIEQFTGVVRTKMNLIAGGSKFLSVKATNAAGKSSNKFYTVLVGKRPNVQTTIKFRQKSYEIAVKGGSLGNILMDMKKEIVSTHPQYKVFFYILSGNNLQNFIFLPTGTTSSLKITTPLNYKRKPFHVLEILAFDGSSHATCQMKVVVEKTNENYLTASQACFQAHLSENKKNIKDLITIPVTNSDRLPGSRYIMINNNNGRLPFIINQHGTLDAKAGHIFDREIQDQYIVTATAGLLKENATFCVNVFVEDMNDHKPNFTQSTYNINVLDSTPVGTSIMAVYATDKDSGSNARLSYSLKKENAYFGIDTKTGIVFVKKSLKAVASETLTLLALVKDHGAVPFSGNAKLMIYVTFDYHRLEFARPEYTFSISENLPKGTLVSDVIKFNVSQVEYEIAKRRTDGGNGDCSSKFWVEPFTGIILTFDVLDAEDFDKCVFWVQARSRNQIVSRTSITVLVNNINDNQPQFVNSSYTGFVEESQNSNTNVLQANGKPLVVKATDLDAGQNGKIKFSFVESAANIYFTIGERSGEIKTNFVLDCEMHPTQFNFRVKATDEGTPNSLYTVVPLTITLTNINDRIPKFVDLKILVLRLPAYKGMVVERLKAKDFDVVPDELTFEMEDQLGVFDIHPKTGDCFVKDPTKLTNQRMVMVQAKVSDTLFHSVVMVQIQMVRYSQDTIFKFFPPTITATVTENEETTAPITLVNPIGYQIGEQIRFRMLNPLPRFTIGETSGLIEVVSNETFDREVTPFFEIHIEAWKMDDLKMVARAVLNVTVADKNDNAPTFLRKKFYKAIDIDYGVGTDLVSVFALDKDAGMNAKIRYSITSGDGDAESFFAIHPDTGMIRLRKKFIKSKASQQYQLVVQASDRGKPSLSSTAFVEMFIINKDQPMFANNYLGEVPEDAQIGDSVATVNAKGAKDRQVYYQIVEGDQYEQFHVGFTTGEVVVAGKLDHARISSYSMRIRAIDSLTGSWSDTICDVTVQDVNNHYPIFEKPYYVVQVNENVMPGSSILKVSAHDSDVGDNAAITYSSTSLGEESMDYFSIDILTGVLSLLSPLDAETKTKHLVQITATDNGSPRKSSFTYLEVVVRDVNDNKPEYLSSGYTFTFIHYTEESHYLGQVHAFDADSNDELSYSIEPPSEFVMVSKETGSVFLIKDLPSSQHQLKASVIVSDGTHTASVDIIIQRITTNAHAPTLSPTIKSSVKENDFAKSKLVTKLVAKDADVGGGYGNMTYHLDDTFFAKYFRLTLDGELYTRDVLFDREEIDQYILPVRVVDTGGRFTLSNIIVTVEDENDNTPRFEFTNYEAHVMTSQVSEESLIHAAAVDRDFDSNSELKYVAHGLEDGSPLVVDNKTGLISLAGFPKGLKYQFSVQVSDNGYPILQSRASIQIAVKSWNHNILAFVNNSYTVNVPENTQLGAVLTTLTAHMKDYKGDVTYEFIDGNLPYTKASEHFQIDVDSGQVTLKKILDYEKRPFFKLLVKAHSKNLDSANVFLHVNVGNTNDNEPRFDAKAITILISEDTPLDSKIIQVRAHDRDDPYGERLTYKLESSASDGMFTVDASNGWVVLKKPLDREDIASHEILISVTDAKSGTIHTDKVKLTLNLQDTNDWSPRFTQKLYTFSMKENSISSHVIGQLKARDKDLDPTIRYYFKPSEKTNRYFTIDSVSGVVTLLRPLQAGNHTFEAIAYDGVNSEPVQVTVNVEHTNSKPPQCMQSYYRVNVAEDWALSEPLTHFKVTKGDENDSLLFLVQGDGASKFEVDKKGVLKATEQLDYETSPLEKFKIVVVDQSGHSCNSDIFLKLSDVNDNTPRFDQDLHMATVREDTSQSVVIAQVRATDLDSYNNRKLIYSITSGNHGNIFAIDQRGIVTVNNPSDIDRKLRPTFSLVVQAKDNGVPSLSSTTRLQIVVLSISDIPPKFDQLGYAFNITENNQENAVVGNIKVTASKNLLEERIAISILNDESGLFFITPTDNMLKVKTKLDYEKETRYAFDIRAHYESIPTLSSTVRVEVQVNDQNDHVPAFKMNELRRQIDENVRSGTFFLSAFAEDGDGSRENSLVTYSLLGDPSLPFTIGSQSGEVRVDGSLDHEKKSFYSFEIQATDNGKPPFSAKVQVAVNITDLNDNAPMVAECDERVIVQERKPIGSDLVTLTIRDLDSDINGAPFSCAMLGGDVTKFKVVSVEGGTKCVVVSKAHFEKKEKDEYKVQVRVADSGSPTQYSDCEVTILVVEESYHAPVIQGSKIFYVIVSPPYGMTKIGDINVLDEDKSDIHQFRIVGGNDAGLFHVQPMTGVIEGKPTEGTYSLRLEVTDGNFVDDAVFKIVVNEFNDKLKTQSVSVVIHGVDVPAFVDSKMVVFVKLVAALSGTIKENVFVWSILELNQGGKRKRRSTGQGVVVALAVKGIQDNKYIAPSNLKSYIESSQSDFEQLGMKVSVRKTECQNTKCPENQKCVVTFTPKDPIVSLYLPNGYVSFKSQEKCYCSDGTEGPVCLETNPCSHNPCKIGEKCVVTSSYFKCECIDSAKCNPTVDTVTLSGESYVSYQLKKSFDELFTTLTMQFRTEAMETEYLFHAYGKDFFILEIDNRGHVKARFDFGSGVGFLVIDDRKVNDGGWHHIHVERYGNYVSMVLDKKDVLKKEGYAPGISAKININGHGIQIGAGLSHDGTPFSGFKGCIKEPRLNNQPLPFSGTNDIVLSVDARKVEPECKDSGRCSDDNCPRFSVCMNTLSNFKCHCLTGHFGPQCKTKLTCKDNPCENGGRCSYEKSKKGTVSYKCTCKQGFTGGKCQITLGPCASRPCLNNGKCIAVNDNTYICKCALGYTGNKCSINMNPCAFNPCRNGGTCKNKYNAFHCLCPPGKLGKQCSDGENCRFDKCLNGGTCLEKEGGSTCVCAQGYFGTRCQYDVDECLLSGNCASSVCVNTFGDYYCNCTSGDKLKVCPIASTKGSPGGFPIMLAAVGAGAFLVIIIVIAACCCFWKKRKRHQVPSHLDSQVKYPLNRYLPHEGTDELAFFPPSPPPRGELLPPAYSEETEQASAAMYDPSLVTFSGTSSPDECLKKVPLKFSPPQSSEYNSEDEEMKSLPGYHWDYSEVPEDMIYRKMSREGSRILPTKTGQYFDDENLECVEMPQLPERPASRRSSLPGYSESEAEIPELPELPQQVRLSRQSLRSSNQSPPNVQPRVNPMSSSEFRNRYSLLSDENEQDASYLHDDDGAETMSELTRVTRPGVSGGFYRRESESSASDDLDGYTETSFNSDDDDDDDVAERRPLDPTRKLERDIQKLIKDLQRRTEED